MKNTQKRIHQHKIHAYNAKRICDSYCLHIFIRLFTVHGIFIQQSTNDNNRWRSSDFCVRKFGIAEKSH